MSIQEPHDTTEISYEIQYCPTKRRLWIHSSTGDTVARFSSSFGIDMHRTTKEQLAGMSQCLHCTHDAPTLNDFIFFCDKAFELWKVEIDKSKIELLSQSK